MKIQHTVFNHKERNGPEWNRNGTQEFMKENQIIFKNNYPDLSSKERLGKIAEEWYKYKETILLIT